MKWHKSKTCNSIISKSISAFLAIVIVSVNCPINDSYAENTTEDYIAMADEMVALVNEARSEEGLNPLYAVPTLYDASAIRVAECVDTFDHYRPDGTLFTSVLNELNVSYYAVGENIAAGNSTAETTFEQWKQSPGHWGNIMDPEYTHIGVGVCYSDESEYGWYWVQVFISNNDEFEGQYLPEQGKITPICCGDVNGDSIVDLFDYVLLVKQLNNKATFNELQIVSADCTADSTITIADAVVLKKYILGTYNTLPVYP